MKKVIYNGNKPFKGNMLNIGSNRFMVLGMNKEQYSFLRVRKIEQLPRQLYVIIPRDSFTERSLDVSHLRKLVKYNKSIGYKMRIIIFCEGSGKRDRKENPSLFYPIYYIEGLLHNLKGGYRILGQRLWIRTNTISIYSRVDLNFVNRHFTI